MILEPMAVFHAPQPVTQAEQKLSASMIFMNLGYLAPLS
jgi:hypothetical protein